MKISARSLSCAVLLVLVAVPVFAQNSGPSATGSFQFSAGGQTLSIEFDARAKNSGPTDGQITLTGNVDLPEQDVDGEGTSSGGGVVEISIQVEVDCLSINGNTAVIGGEIEDASIPAYIGHRALLAVVDNGEGNKAAGPDQFMWGVYGTPDLTWVPSDAELLSDPGVGLTWFATDFEREDDAGIPSHADATIGCQSFSVGSYSFENVPKGGGNIQVRP